MYVGASRTGRPDSGGLSVRRLAEGPGRESPKRSRPCLWAVETQRHLDDDVAVRATTITQTVRARLAEPAVRQAGKFLVIGGTSYLLNLGLYSLALLAGLHYLMAAAVAFCLGFAFNFLTNRSWTFEAEPLRAGSSHRSCA